MDDKGPNVELAVGGWGGSPGRRKQGTFDHDDDVSGTMTFGASSPLRQDQKQFRVTGTVVVLGQPRGTLTVLP